MGANAQTSVPSFTAGEVLTAANMNISARTGVPVFADSTARDAAFGGTGEKTLAEGQLCYLESTNVVQYYDGSNWATVGPSTPSGLVVVKAETAFTAASSVTADNVFSSTYTAYRLVVRYQTSTTSSPLLKLRVGGSSASTNYNLQYAYVQNTTFTGTRLASQTSLQIGVFSNGAFDCVTIVDIVSPNVASPTLFNFNNPTSQAAYTTPEYLIGGGNHSTATAYDGIELLVGSGNMTGHYTIYGYGKTV